MKNDNILWISCVFFALFLAILFSGCAACPTEETCIVRLRNNAEKLSIESCLNNEKIAVFYPTGHFRECRELLVKAKKP